MSAATQPIKNGHVSVAADASRTMRADVQAIAPLSQLKICMYWSALVRGVHGVKILFMSSTDNALIKSQAANTSLGQLALALPKVFVMMLLYALGPVRPVNCRTGADAAMLPCTTHGYRIRIHADSMPP